jgi:ribonucleoside-triphosphate reductase (thioredoxin)
MQNKILGRVSFAAQYAKETKGGRESWVQAVDRVKAMHMHKFKHDEEAMEAIEWAFNFVYEKKVFASQRSMQFGGRAIIRNNMRIYNCTYSACNRIRFFAEAFWLLLSGCGTGFSVRKIHIKQLPLLISENTLNKRLSTLYIIPDNIEGWANAVNALIESYCLSSYYDNTQDKEISFDYSKLRAKGAKISSGGRSPGYKPLELALEKIRARLKMMVKRDRKFKSIDCFDITMFLSEAVLSGGVRRSASIAIFDNDDREMINAKQGEWWKDEPQRAYANISAGIKADGTEDEDTTKGILNSAKQWGEPGIAFFKSNHHGTNPCAEIGLLGTCIKDGLGNAIDYITIDMLENMEHYQKSKGYTYYEGWQACNLTEINMAKNHTKDEFLDACKAASIIGTLQASYNDTGYLNYTSHRILALESLIGVSLTGMCENKLSFDAQTLQDGAAMVNAMNAKYCDEFRVNRASRTTCIKPSGNTSTIAGGISAGIHPHHAKHYIRRMRLSKVNPIWNELFIKVPAACVDLDENTGIVQFACSAPEGAITREDDTALEHLERVKLVYENWIKPGSAHSRVEGLTHNVSNTCTIKPNEWSNVAQYIWDNRESLRGVALLSYVGDHMYDMAPYQTVIAGTDSAELWLDLSLIDWSKVDLNKRGEGESPVLEPACSSGKCEIEF